jgi:hypothetical protein
MSISLGWRLIEPGTIKDLPGLSNDWETFKEVFGRPLTSHDADMLRAMSLVANNRPFWHALLEVVGDLKDDQAIEVVAEW